MKRITSWFFNGLLVVVPAAVTAYVSYRIFIALDDLLMLKLPYRGLGVLVMLLGITLIGFMTSTFIASWAYSLFDKVMVRLPLVKLLYSSVKDLMHAFVGEQKTFDKPVAVSLFGDDGPRVLGFLTADDIGHLGISDLVAVYFPQSYNFAGNLVLVRRERVEVLSADASQVMTFLVSGGVSGKAGEPAKS